LATFWRLYPKTEEKLMAAQDFPRIQVAAAVTVDADYKAAWAVSLACYAAVLASAVLIRRSQGLAHSR
jgi:hypothetical protein